MTVTTSRPEKPVPPTARRCLPSAAGTAGLWLACTAAMAAGLLVDAWRIPAALLVSGCGAPGSLAELAWRHATLMPVSSAAMALAALLPWPRTQGAAPPLAARAICAVLMAVGMILGARLGIAAALSVDAPPFGGMVLGMAAGMAAALLPGHALSAWLR
ncbi:hypothetical protein D3C86_657570 [compost metagenome]